MTLNRVNPFSGVSAGTTKATAGVVSFANSNGVTFGLNGNTITASAAGGGGNFSAGLSTFGNTLGNTGLVNAQLVLVGSNNITLSGSTNGGSMTVSISGGAGGAGNTGYISAGTNTLSLGTAVFSNSNGVSFGVNGQTITATVATNYQSQGAYLTTADLSQNSSKYVQAWDLTGNTAGTTSSLQGTVLHFSGGNSITVSGNSNTIVFSVGNYLTTADLSQNSSKYAGINGAITGGSITVNTSGVSVALPAYLTTAMQSNAATISNVNISAGTTSQNLSNLVFSNSNNFSFGLNGSTITASYTVPTVTAGSDTAGISNLGNTSGTTGVVSGDSIRVLFAGGNNITLSQSVDAGNKSATITISAFNQTVQTQNCVDVTLSGNSTSAGAGYILISSGTMVLAGGNNITLSQNGQSVTISAPNAPAAQTGISSVAASGGTQTVGMISFANSNGITFGMSTGANTGTITASYTVPTQTNQSGNVYASSNTFGTSSGTYDARTISIAGSGAVSVAASNSGWVISAPVQSNQTIGAYAVSNTTQSSSGTLDARSLSFQGAGVASVGYSNGSVVISVPSGGGANFSAGVSTGGNSAGNTGITGTQLVLAGGNNITLSQATGANGATVTISAFNQSNQTVGLYAVGNTTQNSSTTLDARTISYNAIGAASMGYSNGSVQVSVPQTSSLSGTGWISISVNGSTISIGASTTANFYAGGNTFGTSSGTGDIRSITIAGTNGIQVAASNGGFVIAEQPMSAFEPWQLQTNTSVSSFATNSYIFQKVLFPDAMACSKVNILKSLNASVGVNAVTKTFSYTYFHGLTLFSRQDYTNNSSNISSFASASFGISHSFSYNSLSGSATVAWVTNSTGGTSSVSFSDSIISGMTSYLTGLKMMQMPLVATLTSPEIWLAHNESSSSNGNVPVVGLSLSDVYITPLVSTVGAWSNSGRDTARCPQGEGFGNASATGNTMPFSNISAATQAFIYHNYSNVLVT